MDKIMCIAVQNTRPFVESIKDCMTEIREVGLSSCFRSWSRFFFFLGKVMPTVIDKYTKTFDWYWKNRENEWIQYSEEEADAIEKAYLDHIQANALHTRLFDLDSERTINFESMLQQTSNDEKPIAVLRKSIQGTIDSEEERAAVEECVTEIIRSLADIIIQIFFTGKVTDHSIILPRTDF